MKKQRRTPLEAYQSAKNKCVICVVLIALICLFSSCGGTKKVSNYGMNVSNVKIEQYDTIPSQTLNKMILEKEVPALKYWQVSNLTNYEEGKTYTFYFYYDQPNEKMMTLKRIISGQDTSYVRMNKILKTSIR